MKRFLNWFSRKTSPRKATQQPRSQTGARPRPVPDTHSREARPARPDVVELDPHLDGKIEENGPGKNVLIRNRYLREDTGTHDTLQILDDSVLDTGEETGFDPYNTGRFDRSKNWDRRSRS